MLLRRSHLLVIPAVFAVALGACTVKEVDDDDFNDSTGVQTGGGGEGATGAAGGFGGDGATGATGGFGGSGVGGTGGGACVGEDGVETGAACTDPTKLPIAAGASACNGPPDYGVGGNEPPPGIDVCGRIYEIYKGGSADAFLDCAEDIGVEPASACDGDQLQACVTFAHESTCVDDFIVTSCKDIEDQCAGFGDTTLTDAPNTGICEFLLRPFNDTGYAEWSDCATEALMDETVTCLEGVTGCWDQVAAVQ
jgi:hypothetical protein